MVYLNTPFSEETNQTHRIWKVASGAVSLETVRNELLLPDQHSYDCLINIYVFGNVATRLVFKNLMLHCK